MTRDVSGSPARRSIPWIAASAAMSSALLSFGALGPSGRFALVPGAPSLENALRLWTGQAVHYGPAHLRGDLLAFVVWAALVEWYSRRLLVVTLLAGTPLVSLLILTLCPNVREYRGLSALDCALVTELLLVRGLGVSGTPLAPSPFGRGVGERLGRDVSERWLRRTAWGAAALFVAKSAFELVTGRALLAPDLGPGVRLLVPSHWIGALVGGLVLLVSSTAARRKLGEFALLPFAWSRPLYARARLADHRRNAQLFPRPRVLPPGGERGGRLRL